MKNRTILSFLAFALFLYISISGVESLVDDETNLRNHINHNNVHIVSAKHALDPLYSVPLTYDNGFIIVTVRLGDGKNVSKKEDLRHMWLRLDSSYTVLADAAACPTAVKARCVDLHKYKYVPVSDTSESNGVMPLGLYGLEHQADNFPVHMTYYAMAPFFSYDEDKIDGELAFGYPFSAAQLFPSFHRNTIIGLDLNSDPNPSALHIGGVTNETEIEWGLMNYFNGHYFYLYDLSFCGVNLFEDNSNTLVQIRGTCLGLKPSLFALVLGRINGDCHYDKDHGRVHCYMPYIPEQMPELSFKMTEDGDMLTISLLGLVDSIHSGGSRKNQQLISFCLRETGKYSYFGTKVISQLYTAIDYTNRRVGFGPKPTNKTHYESSSLCIPPLHCDKHEVYQEATNTCEPPACQSYFAQILDADNECHIKISFKVIGLSLFTVCALLEVVVSLLSQRLQHRLNSEYPE